MANKYLLAAGIVRDVRFTSRESYIAYLRGLDVKPGLFQVLESRLCQDGTVLARIVTNYNSSPLIELPQSDLEV